ncbi:MAG: hypothetical protein CMJ18_05170 [Phycisphaeraceae bacterium]|nr:hypothetical protein [Phycisphaeraceae bacterium]
MRKISMLSILCAILLMSAGSVHAIVYEVGPGKTYASIQDAVDAVAATDLPGPLTDNASLRDKEIRVFPGSYTENVSIPADPAGSAWNTVNDGWTIRADQRGTVTVNGGFSIGNGRDSLVFDGIDIMVADGQHGVAMFGGTNRFMMFKNMVVDGRNAAAWASGIYHDAGFGQNSANHVTIVNMGSHGIRSTNSSGWYISNSILANNNNGTGKEASFVGINHSNIFGNTTNCNPVGSCAEWDSASGPFGNINWVGGDPVGLDPQFVSTDPSSPFYLFLEASSPSAGTANPNGLASPPHAWEDRGLGTYLGVTHNNMGARPIPEPASLALLAAGALLGIRRRR